MRRVLRELQMLAAFDPAVAATEHRRRQRVRVVQVRVAHVAAVQQDRVVEQRAVAVRRVPERSKKRAKSFE